MERIESDGFFAFRRETRDKKRVGKKPAERAEFTSLLKDRTEELFPAEITPVPMETLEQAEALLDQIHELGDKLSRTRTFSALKEYKRAVQQFLASVVKDSLTILEQTSGSNVLNRKRFAIVTVINNKLDRLAAGMLQTQETQLDLLARVEEINGLLVDLLH